MSESIREGIQVTGNAGPSQAEISTTRGGERYSPDESVFTPDPGNDKTAAFMREVASEAPPRMSLRLRASDGRPERFELDPSETRSYVQSDPGARRTFANGKILERRFAVALGAARRLAERGLPATHENLRPDEEAYLSDLDALEMRVTPLDDGGYADAQIISPRFLEAAARLDQSGGKISVARLREDFFGDGDFESRALGRFQSGTNTLDVEYTPIGPAGQQIWANDVWDMQAKCLDGDTMVPLLDGTSHSMRALANRPEPFWVYSFDAERMVMVPGKATAFSNGTKPCIEVELDNGAKIVATEDHRFMLRDGTYLEAGRLAVGQSLMPLYRRRGKESVWQPAGGWKWTHHLVATEIGLERADEFAGYANRRYVVNHKVAAIREVGDREVFDLSVERWHNFALEAGVYVHNCWWAWHHDPIAQQGINILRDFCLGRGVNINAAEQKLVQPVIEEFWARENIDERLKVWTCSLSRDGNLYSHPIDLGNGFTAVKTFPVATIWEIVTDDEDIDLVYWYIQRYQTRTQQFADNMSPKPESRYIQREIAADEVIHLKINCSEDEVYGRSDLYPILGWLKRLRDYFDSVVQKEQAAAAYQWDYTVQGGIQDVNRIAAQLPSGRPEPGSFFAHNDKVQVKSVSSSIGAVAGDSGTYTALLNHIAVGLGITKNYLGAGDRNNRASALLNSEPSAKRMEERQDVISAFIERLLTRVLETAAKAGRIPPGIDLSFKVIFPAIVKADASAKVDMYLKLEGAGVISKQTLAAMLYSEAELDDVDWTDERSRIQAEIGIDPVKLISRANEMIPKGTLPTTDTALDPGENPAPNALPAPKGASPTSAVGAEKIRKDLGPESEALEVVTESGKTLVIIP